MKKFLNVKHIIAIQLMLYAGIFLSTSLTAYADEFTQVPLAKKSSDLVATVGAGVGFRPEFEGSNKYKAIAVPMLRLEYKEKVFLSTSEPGVGVYIFKEPSWNMGLSVAYNSGRDEGDSELLTGMGDIDSGMDMKFFMEWTPSPVNVRVEVIQGTGDTKGLRVKGSVGHKVRLTDDLIWKNSIGTTYANSTYNQTFFGVTSSQRQNSQRRYSEYNPGGGLKDVSFSSNVTYRLNQNWGVMLGGEYKLLVGPAADSPLVEAGSKNQLSGVSGIVYWF